MDRGLRYLLSFCFSFLDDNRQVPTHKVQDNYGNRKEEVPVVVGNNRIEEVEGGVSKALGIEREHVAYPDGLAVEVKETRCVECKIDKVNDCICSEGDAKGRLNALGIKLYKAELEHHNRDTNLKHVREVEEVEGPAEENHLL